MCRIASIFLLQRLKGSMSGEARDFNNMRTLAVIEEFFPRSARRQRNSAILTETLGEHAPSYATVKKTLWSSLNVVIFAPVMSLVLDDPKQ